MRRLGLEGDVEVANEVVSISRSETRGGSRARLGQLYRWFHYPSLEKDMCYYYPDAAKLGGAIMPGEGSTSARIAGR
ncbi:hypothetical protein L195_g024949 [Trifolium pratense]|uniref:Uncharacterized protein n=1 Tax=Trifolium pratense TaxID=57577 RepID=A0A2K3NF20_TRIPR|nr:hypothetical protein L195_g024949 [Trifolium pratense]